MSKIENLLIEMIYNDVSVIKVPLEGSIVFGPAWKGGQISRDFFVRVQVIVKDIGSELQEWFDSAKQFSPAHVALLQTINSGQFNTTGPAVSISENYSLVCALDYEGEVTLGPDVDVETAAIRFANFLKDSVIQLSASKYLNGVDGK